MFLVLGSQFLLRPRAASAQTAPKPVRIAWLSGGFGAQSGSAQQRAFGEALREAGFVLGQNAVLDARRPDRGTTAEYADLARKLVAQTPAVILAANPSSLDAVTKVTASIPIVGIDLESDPVERGWVASLARPGRNVTGVFLDIPEMSGKHLELLRETRRPLTQVAVLGDPRVNATQFQATEAVGPRVGITLHPVALTHPGEIAAAIGRAARQGSEALLALTSPLVNASQHAVAEAALQHRLASICGFVPAFAEAGGLLAYGPDFTDLFRRAAAHVVAILKGAAPRDLPVQRPTKFPLVVNLKAARALGLALPATLLARADRVIE
jgi:putative tryptophan/tyrosine transport system substrate-binding protein